MKVFDPYCVRFVYSGFVKAADPDEGKNARIFYHIIAEEPKLPKSSFAIDLTRGTLVSTQVLDREKRPAYELAVLATNTPELPVSYSTKNHSYSELVELWKNTDTRDPSLAFVKIAVSFTSVI